MRPALFLLLALGLVVSCSDFNRALKSNDPALKKQVAQKYYDKESWDRAIPLLEELIMITRGTAESEKWNYMHSKAFFNMKDYTLAGYYLGNFTRTFPTSQYAEECSFLSAYCYYRNSPTYELDQTDTKTAIDQLQLFMVRYPNTNLKDSCNNLIDELRSKLEVKAYHGADQYYRMRKYQAASVAFKDFIRVWPNSRYREDAMMLILRSDADLAMNSIENLRVERIREAIRSYRNFADAYPQSVVLDDAEKLHRQLNAALDQATKTPAQ